MKILSPTEIDANKMRFIELMNSIKRPGISDLLAWMTDNSDFFIAPSSARYHGAYDGGLCYHSLNVYDAFLMLYKNSKKMASPTNYCKYSDDTIKIVTLLHDICKVNFYMKVEKVWKDETEPEYSKQWKHYYGYTFRDTLPLGHGEKSVIMLQNFIRLSMEEALAIRWHMGVFNPGKSEEMYEVTSFSNATREIPIVNLICLADYYASYVMEECGDIKQYNAFTK